MREQAMVNPETYAELVENEDLYQSALRVKTYIDGFMTQPRYIEDKQKIEHRIRDMITGKIKLPKFARDDIAQIQRKLQQHAEDQLQTQMKEHKENSQKQKLVESLSQQRRTSKEMQRLLFEKIAKESKVQPLKVKKAQFFNNREIKDKILIGEPVFKRESRNDELRAGHD